MPPAHQTASINKEDASHVCVCLAQLRHLIAQSDIWHMRNRRTIIITIAKSGPRDQIQREFGKAFEPCQDVQIILLNVKRGEPITLAE